MRTRVGAKWTDYQIASLTFSLLSTGKVGAVAEEFEVEEKNKTTKTKEKWTCCQITLVIFSLFSVVAGVTLLVAFPYIFDAVLHSVCDW